MRVWLIRHGKTEWNKTGRYQGQTDLPLSAEGRAELVPAAFQPGRVYVTPLMRTGETARILFPLAEQLEIAALREMDFGDFEGRTHTDMADDRAYREWVDGFCSGRCPHGESRAEFSDRVCAAFEALMDKADSDVVIVAHGGTQMAVMERFADPYEPYFSRTAKNGAGFMLDASDWRQAHRLALLDRVSFVKD